MSIANFEDSNAKKLEHAMSFGFIGDMVTNELEVGDRCQALFDGAGDHWEAGEIRNFTTIKVCGGDEIL